MIQILNKKKLSGWNIFSDNLTLMTPFVNNEPTYIIMEYHLNNRCYKRNVIINYNYFLKHEQTCNSNQLLKLGNC